jgi:superfamily II DNA helicase RecQ
MKCEAVLIYCRAKYLLENVFNFLSNSGISASVFHGSLEHKEKTRIITEFKNKNIRIIISTTALGMGLDFEHLDCIVHFNMAKSLESYVQ